MNDTTNRVALTAKAGETARPLTPAALTHVELYAANDAASVGEYQAWSLRAFTNDRGTVTVTWNARKADVPSMSVDGPYTGYWLKGWRASFKTVEAAEAFAETKLAYLRGLWT